MDQIVRCGQGVRQCEKHKLQRFNFLQRLELCGFAVADLCHLTRNWIQTPGTSLPYV